MVLHAPLALSYISCVRITCTRTGTCTCAYTFRENGEGSITPNKSVKTATKFCFSSTLTIVDSASVSQQRFDGKFFYVLHILACTFTAEYTYHADTLVLSCNVSVHRAHNSYNVRLAVSGSPFFCNLIDGQSASAAGEGLRLVPAHQPSSFNVATHGAEGAELEVSIKTPSGRSLPARILGGTIDGYRVEYTPTEVGTYGSRSRASHVNLQTLRFESSISADHFLHYTASISES